MGLSKKKHLPQLAGEYECTACLACENICPKQAINHYLADDGHVYVKVDSLKCIGCLKCQKVCERSRSNYGENNIYASKLYAAWATDDKDRANATSGGVFAAFARTILKSGGCVIGAELNGFECKHSAIYSIDDIQRLQGSKYMASSMEEIYSTIAEELPHRDVLFSGVGCQCAGILAYFEGFKTDYKLYTVDLVCGGVPSRLLIEKFREQNPDVNGLLSFRSKDRYELKVKTDREEKVIEEKSLPLHGFNCGLTNRYSCYNCQYAKAHRKTDITIGDLWDYSILPNEHKSGISMVIAHSSNGKELLNNSSVKKEEIGWAGVLLHNKRIVCGHQNIYMPRKRLISNYKKLSKGRFVKLYTITMGPADIDLFSFRIIRYIKEKINKKLNEKYIGVILAQKRDNGLELPEGKCLRKLD